MSGSEGDAKWEMEKQALDSWRPLDSSESVPRPRTEGTFIQKVFRNPKFLLPLVGAVFVTVAYFNGGLSKKEDVEIRRETRYTGFGVQSINDQSVNQRAEEILSSSPLIDTHIDLPILLRALYQNKIYSDNFTTPFSETGLYGHVDIPRLQTSKLGGVFWSVWTPCPPISADPEETFADNVYYESLHDTIQQVDIMKRLIRAYPDEFEFATSASQFEAVFEQSKGRKVASVLGIEGLHQIGNSPAAIRLFFEVGVRYITLTHNCNNLYADGALVPAPHWNGLNPKTGPPLIHEFNRLGMLVDLSHVSPATMRDVLAVTKAPVIFSHSSVHSLTKHPRNVPDEVLHLVKKNGGVVQINFAPEFISQSGDNKATLKDVADHTCYIGDLIGWDHVGFGSDFDGIETVPVGMEDVSKYPDLIKELLNRGVSDEDVKKATGKNILRVWKATEAVAKELQKTETFELEDVVKKMQF